MRSILILLLLSGLSYLPAEAQINWLTWEEAQAKNQKEARKFIVDVYTQWCGWCKKMDKATFEQTEIFNYINANYYAVKFDAETRTDIQFKDKVYKYVKNRQSGYQK